MTVYALADILCCACATRWHGAQAQEPGDPPRLSGFECPHCHESAGRIDSRRILFPTIEAARRYAAALDAGESPDDSA